MAESQFSLSWSAHKSNICTGLSSLQQNGEFVDMTLAADGHHVKVHQVIMALASPYLKELMSTAQCPHPVIFLNKMSYSTLSAILEYIYTGEVLVPVDSLTELIEAGKELHIKGLEDMNFDESLTKIARPQDHIFYENEEEEETEPRNDELEECCYFQVSVKDGEKYMMYGDPSSNIQNTDTREDIEDETLDEQTLDENTFDETMQVPDEDMQTDISQDVKNIVVQTVSEAGDSFVRKMEVGPKTVVTSKKTSTPNDCGMMQYTVSTQGSLQLILNRFIYYLKHSRRCGTRQWRCVDYLAQTRCPALVVTKEDMVIQRIGAHLHSFHDKKILKKVKASAVFTAIHEAITEGQAKKSAKESAASEGQHTEYSTLLSRPEMPEIKQ